MPDLELSVTICSWNTRDDLRACLKSLEAVLGEAELEVIVIENNSADDSAEMVAQEFPWVRLFIMPWNLGFTGGHNLAMTNRRAPHVLLLNSDTVVHAGAFRTILDYVKDKPDLGILGPRILNPDGTLQYSCRRFPNPVAAMFRNTILGKLFPGNKFTREYLMMEDAHTQPKEVDWVSGAALFASKALLDKVGPLDNKYFMFCEDMDWCWRAWKAGFKVVYLPTATITHAMHRSTDKAPNRMIGGHHRGMYRFYAKNIVPTLPVIWRPLAIAFSAAALSSRAALFIVKNKLDKLGRHA